MWLKKAVLFVLLGCVSSEDLDFPPGFKFGAASAAYQIEGAWNVSDKGESIWDRYSHTFKERIADGSNGDVASDSYHKWKEDVKIASELGLDFYRFSIAWPRLLSNGLANKVSEDGKKYYNNLIDELINKGIQPMVTLYHWDLPQKLQDLGGWTNPYIVDWFADYARIVYSLYADRVKVWITINEPVIVCSLAYQGGLFAPGIIDREFSEYLCEKNILMAHAKAWRLYDEEYKPKYGGRVALTNHLVWFEGLTAEEAGLADLANEYSIGFFYHPIYSKEGGLSPVIEKILADNSFKKGFSKPRFPNFTAEEIDLVKGTYDFLAFNHYTSRVIEKAPPGYKYSGWPLGDNFELEAKMTIRPYWKYGTSKYFPMYPPGIRNIIKWIKSHYGNVPILITENGYSTTGRSLNDDERIEYYREYLKQVLLAIKDDGANVTAFTAWTLIDNFEWGDGYKTKFGLYEVDYSDPERKRTPRKSASYYSSIIKHHSLNVPDVPDIVIGSGQSRILPLLYICFNLIIILALF